MIIGIWANVEGKNYVVITDNSSQFTEVSVLIIVLGLFVLLVGGVGVAGAIFASTMCGRITLGLVSIIMDGVFPSSHMSVLREMNNCRPSCMCVCVKGNEYLYMNSQPLLYKCWQWISQNLLFLACNFQNGRPVLNIAFTRTF